MEELKVSNADSWFMLKVQIGRINGILEGYLRHFNENQNFWSCWMLFSAAILEL